MQKRCCSERLANHDVVDVG